MVYKVFDEKSSLLADKSASDKGVRNEYISNQELAEELHKQIIRKFIKRQVYWCYEDNIWDVDIAGMQLISKYNKGIRYLICVIDIFSKHA